jgi:hypothetical protein
LAARFILEVSLDAVADFCLAEVLLGGVLQ